MKTPFGGGVGVNDRQHKKHDVYVERNVWAGEPCWYVNYVENAQDGYYSFDIMAHCATAEMAEAAARQLRSTVKAKKTKAVRGRTGRRP